MWCRTRESEVNREQHFTTTQGAMSSAAVVPKYRISEVGLAGWLLMARSPPTMDGSMPPPSPVDGSVSGGDSL